MVEISETMWESLIFNIITRCEVIMADIRGVRAWEVCTPDAAQFGEKRWKWGKRNFVFESGSIMVLYGFRERGDPFV
ncbi:hypothetical protein CPT76_09320 [Paenibacillus sp. AR247]|nr:hypothetical protein CPT76_09320 [Paenibacillus sp. AR247]